MSAEEIALIKDTYVAYHPDGFFEIWYSYPSGFVSGYISPDLDKATPAVYLTDPTETPPNGFVRDEGLRFVCRVDRGIAGEVPEHIPNFFRFMYDRSPVGVLRIPAYLPVDSLEIPARCPDSDHLPQAWSLYKGPTASDIRRN